MKKAFLVVLVVLAMAGCWDDDPWNEDIMDTATADITISKSGAAYTEATIPPLSREDWDAVSGSVWNDPSTSSLQDGVSDGGTYYSRRVWLAFDLAELAGCEIVNASLFIKAIAVGDDVNAVVQRSNTSLPLPTYYEMSNAEWMAFFDAELGRTETPESGEWQEIVLSEDGVNFINSKIESEGVSLVLRNSNDFDGGDYIVDGPSFGVYLDESGMEPFLSVEYIPQSPFSEVTPPDIGTFTQVD